MFGETADGLSVFQQYTQIQPTLFPPRQVESSIDFHCTFAHGKIWDL
jgi:hypothetical protein